VREEVRLALPATAEHVRLARLTVASLAAGLGFSFDTIEDLRIAVDELCYLVGAGGRDGSITLRFEIGDDALVITGEGTARVQPADARRLSEQILAATVDSYELVGNDGRVVCRLVRHREST
jgi:anti-sigma regulatory factor (Ser/Thr protein kinase)